MRPVELFDYVEKDANIAICEAEYKGKRGFAFRDDSLPYFQNRKEACEFSSLEDLHKMSIDDFKKRLFQGLRVEGITRITGYFTKTNNWNKGKLGELRDRNRNQGWIRKGEIKGKRVN